MSEAYLIAAKRGASLHLDGSLDAELRERGHDDDAVDKIIAAIRDCDDLILRPGEADRELLLEILESHGVEGTPQAFALVWNMLQQARALALRDPRRYVEHDLIGMEAIYAQAVAEVDASPLLDQPVRQPSICYDVRSVRPMSPASSTVRPPSAPTVTSLEDHPIIVWGEKYIEDALRNGHISEPKQPRRIYRLFAEMLIEQKVFGLTDIRQTHVADLKALFNELPNSYGKSSRDTTLQDLRKRGQRLKPSERGIGASTLGRHMGNLNKLFEFIRDHGGKIDPELAPNRLRPKKPKRERKRDKRKAFNLDDLHAIFELPCFTGCAGWDRGDPFLAGSQVYHRALYFAVILLAYSSARREEVCGLEIDDIFLDHAIPYIHIRDNLTRPVKNDVSERLIPIHPEALRLGFAKYVEKLRALGYKLVFPDLKSPTSKSPLGDRLYDEFIIGLKAAVPEEGRRKRVIHSFRHTIGAALKRSKVDKETRADILGHAGESATDEIYVDATELKDMLDDLLKVPIVTAHLNARPIMLLPWVAKKEKPPFSHPLRSRKLRAPHSKAPSSLS